LESKNALPLILGLGLLGVAAFIFLKPKPAPKADPLGNILGAAPGVISTAGKIASSAENAGANVIKSGVGLITAGPKAVVSGAKSIVKSIFSW
jgi:hypothetical protein